MDPCSRGPDPESHNPGVRETPALQLSESCVAHATMGHPGDTQNGMVPGRPRYGRIWTPPAMTRMHSE